MTKFELTPKQEDRVQTWWAGHVKEQHPNGVKEMTGAFLRFSFIPTGLGPNVEVECIHCEKSINVSQDFDTDEFFYDDEGNAL